MEYRLAVPEDAVLLSRFVDDQHTQYRPEQLSAYLKREDAKAFLAVEGEVAGFAYGCVLHRPDGRKDFYLHAIDVAEPLQGCGYGTALMSFINDWCRAEGFRKLFLATNKSNEKACRCYEKAGGIAPADDNVIYVFQ